MKSTPRLGTFHLYALSVIGSGVGFMTQILVSGFWSTAFAQDVTFYSVNLAFYFLSLGIGTQLSRAWSQPTDRLLVGIVALACLWCGLSISVLRWGIFRFNEATHIAVLTVCVAGVLAGLVLPLTLRLAAGKTAINLGRLFFLDYMAAIVFVGVFTFVMLVPLGYTWTALVICFSMLAAVAGLVATSHLPKRGLAAALVCCLALPWPAAKAASHLSTMRAGAPGAKVLVSRQSHYQKIVLTESEAPKHSLLPGIPQHALYLDGFIQFTSSAEQLYHFCIANLPATAAADTGHPVKRALILGGGDGLAARNLLALNSVEFIDLVELDPAVIDLAKHDERLRAYNLDSLANPKVKIHTDDAFTWVARGGRGPYDLVVIDLPSPKNLALARLFSAEFYTRVFKLLGPSGFLSIQAGPYYGADDSGQISRITAGIARTVESIGQPAWIYRTPRDADAFVLSTNAPGFSMADFATKVGIIDKGPLSGVCAYDPEIRRPAVAVNTLNTLPLATYAMDWYRTIGGKGFFYYGDYYGIFLPD